MVQFQETSKGCQGTTSRHGLMRTMERGAVTEQQARRMIRNAWERGLKADKLARTWQRRYLERHVSLTETGYTQGRVYGNFMFIFSAQGVLITMIALPENFYRNWRFDGKTRIRNARRYERMNPEPAA